MGSEWVSCMFSVFNKWTFQPLKCFFGSSLRLLSVLPRSLELNTGDLIIDETGMKGLRAPSKNT